MADHQFKKGQPKIGGRKKGSLNKVTRTVKSVFAEVFNELQDDPKSSLLAFAKKYPRDFYNLSTKLIPTEINAQVEQTVIKVVRE